ncbi:hypothetical protein WME90_02235 [Sorangium sp. So ce375]|uniref:hypothetical protein n=1 Tax=Sorangium sp. So ce375 TaxID=3133306 RepID=UPI003F5B4F2A
MRRSAFQSVTALVALLAASACTQDFDQFDPELFPGSSGTGSGGAGSSSGADSGGGGQTTAGSTTSGGSDGAERCTNGEDDDGDGAVDCADDDCGGFACVAVPDGWQGPGVLYAGPAAADIACPEGFSERMDVGGRDPLDEPATCTPCTCGAPTVTCEDPVITLYGQDACDGLAVPLPVPANRCTSTEDVSGLPLDSYSGEAPGVDSAACPASGGAATVPPPRFGTEGLVCAAAPGTGGCAAGEACAPREIDAPFEPGICVWREGDRRCPREFSEQHVFASSVVDDRGCTQCTCDTRGVSCSATMTLFRDADCTRQNGTVPLDGACIEEIPQAAAVSVKVTGAGSCQPRGGAPTGEVQEGDDRITVCCTR